MLFQYCDVVIFVSSKPISGDNVSSDLLRVNMTDTLIDAANAIGIIGAIAFQDEAYNNLPKHVVAITGISAASAMNSRVVSFMRILTIEWLEMSCQVKSSSLTAGQQWTRGLSNQLRIQRKHGCLSKRCIYYYRPQL